MNFLKAVKYGMNITHICGAMRVQVTNISKLEQAVRAALDHDGPALVEVMTDAILI